MYLANSWSASFLHAAVVLGVVPVAKGKVVMAAAAGTVETLVDDVMAAADLAIVEEVVAVAEP